MRAMLGGAALACLAGRAEAADARLRFGIPPRSYTDALIDLGLQANISVVGTANCGSGGRVELSGRHSIREALDRLLDGAPCRYTIIDARTVRILPAAAPRAPPPDHDAPRAPALVSEIVVTATKRPASLEQLPAGVSAISRDQIAATRAVDVGQTIGQLAGVLTTNLGPGRDKLLIRGLSDGAFTGRTRSTVSTYLDDAPINYNAPDPDLRLVDIDRVEVVRGPQGALYGSGSLAGIYRIVTSKPDLERSHAGAAGGVSWTKGGERSHELEGYASLPLVKDRIGVRIAAYEDLQGGYLDDTNLRIANVDQTRRDGGRIALRVRFDDHWRLDALAATQHLRSNDTQYVIVGMSTGPDSTDSLGIGLEDGSPIFAPGERRNRIREAHNNDFSYGGVTLQGDFEWGSFSSSTSYVHHVFSSQFDAFAAFDPDDPMAPLNGLGTRQDLGVFTEATRSNLLVQDLVVRSSGRGRFDWLLGGYAARTLERSPSSVGLLSTGGQVTTAYTETRKDRQREYAVYGEGSYELGRGWSVTLGGRLFETRVHTTAALDIIRPYQPRFFDKARTFNGFSPKISLQRRFSNGDLVYGLITEGYRPGGFNSSGFLPIRPDRTTFTPDRLRNYELGVKLRRFDNRLGVRAAAYYDDWVRIQTDRYRTSGLAYTANVSDARIVGLEAEVAYDWPFGLSLQLNGLISDSQIKNPNPAFQEPVADHLPGVPDVSGGLLAVYERPLMGDLTFRFIGEASYVGRATVSFDANQSSRMGHYLRAQLSAEVATEAWRLSAYVTNPTNEEGDTFAYGNPFSFSRQGVRQATPQRPRTVGMRLSAEF